MKRKPLNFIIPLKIYPFDIMVSFDETDEEFLKNISKFGISKENCLEVVEQGETVRGRCAILESNQTVIRFFSRPVRFNYEAHGLIAHEIFHATTFIMDRVGMKLSLLKSDEAYAYLHEYITKEVYKKLLDKK